MRANLMANAGRASEPMSNGITTCSRLAHYSAYRLSLYRLDGNGGLPRDIPQGIAGIKAAADGGTAEAQHTYAIMCANGSHGVIQSSDDAVAWMTRAARNEHAESCGMLSIVPFYCLRSLSLLCCL
jgi:TPR repeat protein